MTETATIASSLEESSVSIEETYYRDLDAGLAPASLSTYRRVARRAGIQTARTGSRRRRQPPRAPAPTPTLQARAPRDVLCWDITFLPGKYHGIRFALYVVIELFSRAIVGFTVQTSENKYQATAMMERIIGDDVRPVGIVHSDNGGAMKSSEMMALFKQNKITASFIRPGVSNDNAYAESLFRTVKFGPSWPGAFEDIDHAYTWFGEFANAYNTEHHHSGIAGYTPEQVYDGTWKQVHAQRQAHLDQLYNANPRRYRRPPKARTPNALVSINLENNEKTSKINPVPTAASLLAA